MNNIINIYTIEELLSIYVLGLYFQYSLFHKICIKLRSYEVEANFFGHKYNNASR